MDIGIHVVEILKLLQVLLVSGIKFLFGPLVSLGYGYNYLETLILTTAGGVLGLVFFFFLSKWLIRQLNLYLPIVTSAFHKKIKPNEPSLVYPTKATKRKFTKRNKMIIRIRNKYGFPGIILLTPVLFSIPIGTFLAQKYYPKKSHTLVYLSLSVIWWSFFLSSFVFLIK